MSELSAFRDRYGIPAVGSALVTADGAVELDLIGGRVRGGRAGQRRRRLAHRLVRQGDDRGALRAAGRARRGGVGRCRSRRCSPTWTIDPGWSAVTIDDVFVGEGGLQPNLSRAAMGAAYDDDAAAAAPALRGDGDRARARPSPARALPLLQPRLHRHRRRHRADRRARPTSRRSRRTCSSRSASRPAGSGRRRRSAATARARPRRPTTRAPTTRRSWARPAACTSTSRTGPASSSVFLTEGGGFLAPASVERLLTPAKAQSPGWAPARGLAHVSMGQQGSNTFWVATALIDRAASAPRWSCATTGGGGCSRGPRSLPRASCLTRPSRGSSAELDIGRVRSWRDALPSRPRPS